MKVNNLQQLLISKNLDGFIFSTTDEYLNEYSPDCNNRLEYISNFTGSFGVLLVLQNSACLFVDGRYTLAAKDQVDLSVCDVELFSVENMCNWLIKSSNGKKLTIAINSRITSIDFLALLKNTLQKANTNIMLIENHLVDEIWENRPSKPKQEVFLHDEKYGSLNYKEKIKNISNSLKSNHIDAFLVTALDNIAWLLNIRGSDIPCNPISLSKLIITKNGNVHWFIDTCKIDKIKEFLPTVFFHNEEDLESFLTNFIDVKIFGLSKNSPSYYKFLLEKNNFTLKLTDDFCTLEKALKNNHEITSIKGAHIRDGAYLVKLYHKIFNNPSSYDEISIDEELSCIKSLDPLYKGSSFDSIVGIDFNGAIVHYHASKQTCKKLTSKSYLLLDCGSQYLDGTTDITRVFSFGVPSEEFKKHYTLVLKGHIAVATLNFKEGTTGSSIDLIARKPLWEYGLDFAHGTGHGIGFYLCVHEGPQSISPLNHVPLQEGMIVSNEPGFYLENHYGIRLENLYVVKKSSHKGFLCFENLSLAPFDIKSINFSMLTAEETAWLENYHNSVYEKLSPLLDNEDKAWLKDFINIK